MHTTVVPLVSLTLADLELLNKCIWNSITFLAKMSPHTEIVDGHVIYRCIYGWKNGADIVLNDRGFRYSELLELYTHISTTYKLEGKLPPFPPKHMWGNTYKSVIDERIKAFDAIFRSLTSFGYLDFDEKLAKFFDVQLNRSKETNYRNAGAVDLSGMDDVSAYVCGDT